MSGFFSKIESIFNGIIKGVKKSLGFIFKNVDEAVEHAELIAKPISDLMGFVLPISQQLAAWTEGTEDDKLVAAALSMNTTVQGILAIEDDGERKGKILSLIGNAAKLKLKDLADDLNGQKIKIGKLNIRLPEDVDKIAGDFFDFAAQAAYTLFIRKRDDSTVV